MCARKNLLKKIIQGVLVGLSGVLLALLLHLAGVLTVFEGKAWDWRVQLFAKPGKSTEEIILILLDQNSLDWGKAENSLSWPWPREVYTFIINFCKRAKVKTLAFDVLFLEPSIYGVYDDSALAASVADFGQFICPLFLGTETGDCIQWPADIPEPNFTVSGNENTIFPRASFPISELAQNSQYLANVNMSPDSDGVYRRGKLISFFDGKAIPSLAAAVYVAGHEGINGANITPGSLVINNLEIPLDSKGNAILNYRGPTGTHKTYSAAAVIQSELKLLSGETPTIDPSLFKDRYVFFGFNAPGLLDLRPSPVSPIYPGVEINATMLDNMLSKDFIKETSVLVTVLIAILLAVLAGIAVSLISGALKNALVYIVFLPLPIILCLLAYYLGYWLPLIATEVSVALTLIGSGLLNYATEGRQKRYIKSAFKQYLSPAVIEKLITNPENLKLGGERRQISIFFSDIEGFTGISERLSPEELTGFLNEYLSAMTDIIQEQGGTIDKYEGDAIIAFWNAPVDQPDHALRSVRAALRCQEKLSQMRASFRDRAGKDLYMRIGINSGPAVVGNMGSHNRFDYTMLGDSVNLASRLEGINKQFNTYTMISHATLERTENAYPARELSRVTVVGRNEPVTVYEPMFEHEYSEKKKIFSIFAHGLKAFYDGRFNEAEKIFAGIAEKDPASSSYAAKCRELLTNPPENWTGVWVMTLK